MQDDLDQKSEDSLTVRVIIPDQRSVTYPIEQSLTACKSILVSNSVVGSDNSVMLLAPVVSLGKDFAVPVGAGLRIVSEADPWCASR